MSLDATNITGTTTGSSKHSFGVVKIAGGTKTIDFSENTYAGIYQVNISGAADNYQNRFLPMTGIY